MREGRERNMIWFFVEIPNVAWWLFMQIPLTILGLAGVIIWVLPNKVEIKDLKESVDRLVDAPGPDYG